MKSDKREEIFTAIDSFTARLRSALDAGNEAAKALVTIWLESLETTCAAQGQAAHDGNESLMTIKQLAKRWGVSERSIRDWVSKGGLPCRYVGADLRFDLAEVDEWTKRHRKNNRALTATNGKVTPLQTRLQAR